MTEADVAELQWDVDCLDATAFDLECAILDSGELPELLAIRDELRIRRRNARRKLLLAIARRDYSLPIVAQ